MLTQQLFDEGIYLCFGPSIYFYFKKFKAYGRSSLPMFEHAHLCSAIEKSNGLLILTSYYFFVFLLGSLFWKTIKIQPFISNQCTTYKPQRISVFMVLESVSVFGDRSQPLIDQLNWTSELPEHLRHARNLFDQFSCA